MVRRIAFGYTGCGTCLKQIQEMNFECAMVIRNGARAELALNKLERLKAFCRREAKEFRRRGRRGGT